MDWSCGWRSSGLLRTKLITSRPVGCSAVIPTSWSQTYRRTTRRLRGHRSRITQLTRNCKTAARFFCYLSTNRSMNGGINFESRWLGLGCQLEMPGIFSLVGRATSNFIFLHRSKFCEILRFWPWTSIRLNLNCDQLGFLMKFANLDFSFPNFTWNHLWRLQSHVITKIFKVLHFQIVNFLNCFWQKFLNGFYE